MMNSKETRSAFLKFFTEKQHQIVPSAPMVVKNDPTLMFTNAGMNQFKDIFLGNSTAKYPRVANSQKCLRVSGKHNDLEEVGRDTYHHTMFEMLGNWSFGDYFKKEAIAWAWEFLTEVVKINKELLYVTVFGGDEKDKTEADNEAFALWKEIVPEDHILYGSKKDNFWEMGESGPCGPCSEIHIDLRSEEEKQRIPGRDLVNKDNPLVIEIWNLVFIQYNRQANGQLVPLADKFVDTGMGFERLCMVLQQKQSNYDTDVFQPLIQAIARVANLSYGADNKADIAMRVIADHLRAIAFAIADGQLPSNTGAGYVIRRILRRAVRYGYTFLHLSSPFLCELVDVLVQQMGEHFPELQTQKDIISKVMREEEAAFLRTLANGIQRFDTYIDEHKNATTIDGDFAFELFDTYGFPIDLTRLMAEEKGYTVDMDGFNRGLEQQKARSRKAAEVETDDWVEVFASEQPTTFVGYDTLTAETRIVKYRKVKAKNKQFFQLVLQCSPFYAESGGQVGDRGVLMNGEEKIAITNTIKENNLNICLSETLPANVSANFTAVVDEDKRHRTENNHTATHLLHAALRQVLGTHVAQKGSLVNEDRLRFDFSHFAKVTPEEIRSVERIVNKHILENIPLVEHRNMPIDEARKLGAMALFGEKYGEFVRVVKYDKSIEFCGGTHAKATGQIGMVKIISEGAIAAGVRRIEAITADAAENYLYELVDKEQELRALFNNTKDIKKAVEKLLEENRANEQKIADFAADKAKNLKDQLAAQLSATPLVQRFQLPADIVRNAGMMLQAEHPEANCVFGGVVDGKPYLQVQLSEALAQRLSATDIIREAAKEIKGGGNGKPTFATAGGKNPDGLDNALQKALEMIKSVLQ